MNPFHGDQPLSEVERFAALSRIGTALISERDEGRLLQRIAQTAVDLMGAEFAAFTLRPVNEHGELSVPSEGHLFHLAAVIGVTQEQEELFRRVPLGGDEFDRQTGDAANLLQQFVCFLGIEPRIYY